MLLKIAINIPITVHPPKTRTQMPTCFKILKVYKSYRSKLQQNIANLCAIGLSDFVLWLLFADALCTLAIQKKKLKEGILNER